MSCQMVLKSGGLLAGMWYHSPAAASTFLLCWKAKKKRKIPPSSSGEPRAESSSMLKRFWPVHLNKITSVILEQQNTLLLLAQQGTEAEWSLLEHRDTSAREPCWTCMGLITGNTRATDVILLECYGNNGHISTGQSQWKVHGARPWVDCVPFIAEAGSVSFRRAKIRLRNAGNKKHLKATSGTRVFTASHFEARKHLCLLTI